MRQIRQRGSRAILAAAVLALVAPVEGDAKCAFARLEVVGVIKHECSDPIAGAQVMVFLDEEREPLAEFDSDADWAPSSTTGEFRVEGRFTTYSGSGLLGGDRCTREPKGLMVLVEAEGYYPIRLLLARRDFRLVRESALVYRAEIKEAIPMRKRLPHNNSLQRTNGLAPVCR